MFSLVLEETISAGRRLRDSCGIEVLYFIYGMKCVSSVWKSHTHTPMDLYKLDITCVCFYAFIFSFAYTCFHMCTLMCACVWMLGDDVGYVLHLIFMCNRGTPEHGAH